MPPKAAQMKLSFTGSQEVAEMPKLKPKNKVGRPPFEKSEDKRENTVGRPPKKPSKQKREENEEDEDETERKSTLKGLRREVFPSYKLFSGEENKASKLSSDVMMRQQSSTASEWDVLRGT